MAQLRRLPLALFCGLIGFAAPVPKIAPDLKTGDPSSVVDVIVQFNHAPTDAEHQKVASRGGTLKTTLGITNGALYSVPAGQLESLSEDPDVVYISPDRPLQQLLDVTAPSVNAQIGW